MAKEVKFQLGDCSDVFVKKVRGGYEVRVCGEYEGNNYREGEGVVAVLEPLLAKVMKKAREEVANLSAVLDSVELSLEQ